ncbi:hypothetical protein HY387_01020 [Candidatus Daviesbacteria bacterium]|nr:hypothetical protein [Candidatus Daviesbacteria bacterium]
MTEEIEKHLSANMNLSKKQIMLANFLGGFSWGVGSVIGASVVVAIIGTILTKMGVFSAIGGFFEQLNALKNLPQVPNL